jgi:hypothetical protein
VEKRKGKKQRERGSSTRGRQKRAEGKNVSIGRDLLTEENFS